jgi:hypothetical protein
MKRLGFALSVLAVVASAAWAYHVNYKTKTALGRVGDLRGQIAAEREALEVLRVEWAYLNAPDRLIRLVALHNDRLGLVPMGPQRVEDVAAIPYPSRNPELDEVIPEAEVEALMVVSEQVPLIVERVPVPAPRPASWRLQ